MLSMDFSVSREKGFTLIEMMVTVAVLAILLAISAPSLRTVLVNMQIRSVSESLLVGLQLARTEALRRNTPVTFWMVSDTTAACALAEDGSSWVVSLDDPAGQCDAVPSPTADARIVQVRAGNEVRGDITIAGQSDAGADAWCITFDGFGSVRLTCTNGDPSLGQIDIDSDVADAREMSIRISPRGGARLCDPSINDQENPADCGA